MYLGAMGITLADLPNGGARLRLYINYPPGSPQATPPLVGNPNGCRTTAGCFMTGHYDINLPGGPCSQADGQEFPSWAAMSDYAGAHGETLVMASSDAEVNALCSSRRPAPAAAAVAPPPVVLPSPQFDSSGGVIQTVVSRRAPSSQFVSTGVQTPTIVPISTGPSYPSYPTPAGSEQPSTSTDYLPWVIGGGLVLLLLTRR